VTLVQLAASFEAGQAKSKIESSDDQNLVIFLVPLDSGMTSSSC
jgi:hypothetical protein